MAVGSGIYVQYADFWLRLVAYLIDGFIVNVAAFIVFVVFGLFGAAMADNGRADQERLLERGRSPERALDRA